MGWKRRARFAATGRSSLRWRCALQMPTLKPSLREAGIELEPGNCSTTARTVIAGDVTATEAFRAAGCAFRMKDRS